MKRASHISCTREFLAAWPRSGIIAPLVLKEPWFREDPSPETKAKAMGQLGRITTITIADLPERKIFIRCIIEAVRLNEIGIKVPAKPKLAKKEWVVPADLMASLKANKKAQATFKNFSYSHRKEYVQWITAAKTEETRLRGSGQQSS